MIFDNQIELDHASYKLTDEIYKIIFLYIVSVICILGLGKIIGTLYIFAIIYFFLKSKRDYFWIALFFILATKPANFFASYSAIDSINRLPVINIASGISLASEDLFIIAVFIKAALKKGVKKSLFFKPISIIVFFGFFSLIASFITDGETLKNKVPLTRNFFSYFLLFGIPVLINNKIQLLRFTYLLLPFTFFFLFSSVFYFMAGDYLVNFIVPDSMITSFMSNGAERLMTLGGGHYFLLFTFVLSLMLLLTEKKGNNYLILTAMSSYLSILMTATRIWFIIFSLILIVFMLKYSLKYLMRTIIPVIIIAAFFSFSGNKLATGLNNTSERLFSVFAIGDENSLATNSLAHKTEADLPLVVNGFLQNPIYGIGFTKYYVNHNSPDVGNFNLLQESGFIGFILFTLLWLKYFRVLRKNVNKNKNNIEYKNFISIFKTMFIGLLIAHFTTNQFFGLTRPDEDIWLLTMILVFTEYYKPNRKPLVLS